MQRDQALTQWALLGMLHQAVATSSAVNVNVIAASALSFSLASVNCAAMPQMLAIAGLLGELRTTTRQLCRSTTEAVVFL